MRIRVFLSFEHTQKERVGWFRDQLRRRGHLVVTEDDFGAASPREEMARAVRECDIVVAFITHAYTRSRATQRELDLAEAHGKPVVAVFAGLGSRSPDAAGYVAYRRVELSEPWTDHDDQWDRLFALVDQLLAAEIRRGIGHPRRLTETSPRAIEEAVLLHDIEDRMLARAVVRGRPGWRLDHDPNLPHALLWTAASAEPHSIVRRQFESLPRPVTSFLMTTPGAATPPAGLPAIAVDAFVTPARVSPVTGKAAGPEVQRLLRLAAERNQHIPLDVFIERFCSSDTVAELLKEASELAGRELHEGDTLRLEAVCEHALALRFYGDWREAVELLDNEIQASSGKLPREAEIQRLRLALEKINLEYELGKHRSEGLEREVREVQLRFGSLNYLHGYVQAGRVRGNIQRERGAFDAAERTFQRTIGVAEYLAEHSPEGGPGQLILADCHRELAGLYIARRDPPRASRALAEARELLSVRQDALNPANRYLSAVLDYVGATLGQREDVLVKAATPTEQAGASLATLSGFGNPIRVASLYDWLGRAWARQIPRQEDDLLRGEEYLRKALRIREAHGHRYACGLSHRSLGEMYQALGRIDKSIEHYHQCRTIFNQRGVRPALATAHGALAKAYFHQYTHGDRSAGEKYREHLELAELRYQEIELDNEGRELRYELEHGGRKPFNAVSDDTPLIAVGEYHLHRWIREFVTAVNPPVKSPFTLRVGIGDDAAMLSVDDLREKVGLVFTTDSAPGSLSNLARSPEYVGRFAVIQTLADILAMGAEPVGLLVNIFLSRAANAGYVRRLIEAVVREAQQNEVAIFGGDIKERDEQSVGCVGIGRTVNGHALTRDAARQGQAVCITMASDPAGSGSRLIGARWAQELIEFYRLDSPGTLRDFPLLHGAVDPRLKYDLLYVPRKVMAAGVRTGLMKAAIDTSDGVLACLEILGRESEVGFVLDEPAIDAIIDDRARRLAEVFELPASAFLFSAGHDWEIVFTCDDDDFPELSAAVDRALQGNGRVARIGRVAARTEQSCAGVPLTRLDGSTSVVPYYTDEKFVPRHYQDRPSQWLSFASRIRVDH